MAKLAAVILADGFEPLEVVAPTDVLRRGGVEVALVSIMGGAEVISAHNIAFHADMLLEEINLDDCDMIIVPGGSVGVENIMKNETVREALTSFMQADKLVAAICAGPMVLADCRLLIGRKATCYPGCEDVLPEGTYVADRGVVVDDNLITANGPASALPFGLALLEALCGKAESETVAKSMLYK
ncbi:DJ-1 family glyoxalase III [Eggerthellaceae bacterium 3-80]|nr:DJ-1/PfpI family protein [bacterium D16-34]